MEAIVASLALPAKGTPCGERQKHGRRQDAGADVEWGVRRPCEERQRGLRADQTRKEFTALLRPSVWPWRSALAAREISAVVFG